MFEKRRQALGTDDDADELFNNSTCKPRGPTKGSAGTEKERKAISLLNRACIIERNFANWFSFNRFASPNFPLPRVVWLWLVIAKNRFEGFISENKNITKAGCSPAGDHLAHRFVICRCGLPPRVFWGRKFSPLWHLNAACCDGTCFYCYCTHYCVSRSNGSGFSLTCVIVCHEILFVWICLRCFLIILQLFYSFVDKIYFVFVTFNISMKTKWCFYKVLILKFMSVTKI